MKYLSKTFAHFYWVFIFLLLICRSLKTILYTSCLSGVCFVNTLFQPVVYLFISVMVS